MQSGYFCTHAQPAFHILPQWLNKQNCGINIMHDNPSTSQNKHDDSMDTDEGEHEPKKRRNILSSSRRMESYFASCIQHIPPSLRKQIFKTQGWINTEI